jgi:hypothetical protein
MCGIAPVGQALCCASGAAFMYSLLGCFLRDTSPSSTWQASIHHAACISPQVSLPMLWIVCTCSCVHGMSLCLLLITVILIVCAHC